MSELDSTRQKQLEDALQQLLKASQAVDTHNSKYPPDNSDVPFPFRPETEAVVNKHLKEASKAVEQQKTDALLQNIILKNETGLPLSPEEEKFVQIKRQLAGEQSQ